MTDVSMSTIANNSSIKVNNNKDRKWYNKPLSTIFRRKGSLESAELKDLVSETDSSQGEHSQSFPTYNLYSSEHINELNKLFPIKQWDSNTTEAELAFNAGQRYVVDHILSRLTKEQKKVLLTQEH